MEIVATEYIYLGIIALLSVPLVIKFGRASYDELTFRNNKTAKPREDISLLKVHTAQWKGIGPVDDFEVDKPLVLLAGEEENDKKKQRLIYVWRTWDGFSIMDMERGGRYEWEIQNGQVMIRRRLADPVPAKEKIVAEPVYYLRQNTLAKL